MLVVINTESRLHYLRTEAATIYHKQRLYPTYKASLYQTLAIIPWTCFTVFWLIFIFTLISDTPDTLININLTSREYSKPSRFRNFH